VVWLDVAMTVWGGYICLMRACVQWVKEREEKRELGGHGEGHTYRGML
jgi:hypothetical protein